MSHPRPWIACLVGLLLASPPALFAEEVVNVYSARKEALIQPILDRFTETTGVRTRLVTAGAGPLLERLRSEGRNSPADLLLTVDAGRLHHAKAAGVLQPVTSAVLNAEVPQAYRDPQGYWYGLSLRARPLMVARNAVPAADLTSYESLADPRWRGKICIRSSSNIYNQSLVASMIAAHGESDTQEWLNGLVANFARAPKGGDRDQIRAAAAGECDIAVANTYYLARMRAADPGSDDRKAADKIQVVWPNQADRGAHVNVSGAGVTAHAPHKRNAVLLIEFLVSDEAQAWYAQANNEYPVKPGVPWSAQVLELGAFKPDRLGLEMLGVHNALAVRLMDRARWR